MLELPDAWVWDFWFADDGERYHLFFLRASRALRDPERRHRRASVGHAVSADLRTWTPRADVEPWRDPWVFPDPGGDGWHLITTARALTGPPGDRGVVGHGWSPDLVRWEARPPLTPPGGGFDRMEVMQVEIVDGRPMVLFSCLHPELSPSRRAAEPTGGIWAAAGARGRDVFDAIAHVGAARLISDHRLYVGRTIRDRNGDWMLLAFHNKGPDGGFIGAISDPMPLPRPW